MTKKDRKELGKYIRWIADAVELRDWTIELEHDPPKSEDSFAAIFPVYGRKVAHLYVCEDIREHDLPMTRHCIVHELVHLHLAALQNQAERDLENVLSGGEEHMFFQSFKRNLEYSVDGLSSALAKHLPLIEWPK